MMVLIVTVCYKKSNWLECHRYNYLLLKNQFTNTLLLEDSIIASLSRYLEVWHRYFTPFNALNLGIGGDQVENMLWRAKNLVIPPLLKNVVVLCGTNNLFTDFSCGYSWLYCQHWLLFAWKIQKYKRFYLWVDPERKGLVRKYSSNQGRQ